MQKNNDIDPLKFSWGDLVRAILYLFGEKKREYLFSLFVVAVFNLYVIVPPLIIGKVVDFFITYKSGESLNTFYFYVTFLGIFIGAVHYFNLSVIQKFLRLSNELVYKIRVQGFEKLLEQSLVEHGEENTGAKHQKIQNGVVAFNLFSEALNDRVLPAIATLFGVFSVFLYLNFIYNIILIAYLIGFVYILRFFRKKFVRLHHEKNLAMEKSSGTYIEGLSNITTIKSSGAEKTFKNVVSKNEEARNFFDQEILSVRVNQWKLFQIYNGVYMAIFLFVIGSDVIAGVVTIGSIAILLAYLEKITDAAGKVLGMYGYLIDKRTAIARMMTIFWANSNISTGNKKFPIDWREIKLSNASYAYKNEKNTKTNIDGVNLVIAKNQKVGIIGTTGSGKSTLVKLLLGLYPLDKGEYKIGSTNFYDIKHDEIFKHMAIVLQESEMFNISLKENIALSEDIDGERLLHAINIAQLNEVVKSLPNGFETLIGEKGYHLSGGERQRVGIARAIYKDPEIMIFDEATSSLDVQTEKKIQKALLDNLQQKTIIIVAHRTNTLEKVDVIYKVEGGKIVNQGSYEEFFGK